jgi:flagella basal body P-ring formation protein FlgA
MGYLIHRLRTILILLTAISVLMVEGASDAWAGDFRISLIPKASVAEDIIRLTDIARISGPDCALKRDLARLVITQSPKSGRSLKIRDDYIAYRLRTSGLPLDRVEYKSLPSVTVTRDYQAIDQKLIRKIFEEYVSTHEPYTGREWELLRLKTGVLPQLPVGRLTKKILPGSSSKTGYLSISIIFYVDGREAGQVRASGRINVFDQAIVAARTIERNQVVGANDVKKARINIVQAKHGLVTDPEKIIGLSSRRRILAGQPILFRYLERRTAIKKGDNVTILAESGPIRITDMGQTKQDGAVGDKIAVLNMTSKKIIMAEVMNPNLVKVTF